MGHWDTSPLDFQLVNFGGSLTSQTLATCVVSCPVERFLAISTWFHFSHVHIGLQTYSFVTGFCILYVNFVIGVYRSSVNFGAPDIVARKYMYEKSTECPNFTYLTKNIFPDFSGEEGGGGGVNAPYRPLLSLRLRFLSPPCTKSCRRH